MGFEKGDAKPVNTGVHIYFVYYIWVGRASNGGEHTTSMNLWDAASWLSSRSNESGVFFRKNWLSGAAISVNLDMNCL